MMSSYYDDVALVHAVFGEPPLTILLVRSQCLFIAFLNVGLTARFLEVNTRSDRDLANILAEMRECKLSMASYKLLQSRIVGATTAHGSSKVLPAGMVDPRLMQAPFDDPQNPPVHVVFRHSARALLSYQNASRQAERLGRPLYVVFAQDSIAGQHDSSHTDALKDGLLQKTHFVNTGYLPSCMFVYIGMQVLLQKMQWQKLGLSKCCEAVVKHIHFSKAERACGETRKQGPIVLAHMPGSLVLRALVGLPCHAFEGNHARSVADHKDRRP